jgi:hypothetical protein
LTPVDELERHRGVSAKGFLHARVSRADASNLRKLRERRLREGWGAAEERHATWNGDGRGDAGKRHAARSGDGRGAAEERHAVRSGEGEGAARENHARNADVIRTDRRAHGAARPDADVGRARPEL